MRSPALPSGWESVPAEFRGRGLRWTETRRLVVEVLAAASGHVTAAEVVERCRERDPRTVPSTVYRTLDVLDELGLVRHAHGADGRQEYHVRPDEDHGHLHCESCGSQWELRAAEVAEFLAHVERHRAFSVDLSHLTLVGRCADCGGRPRAPAR